MFRGYSLGFCHLDLLALICMILITAIIIVHHVKFRKKKDEYQGAVREHSKKE